MIAICNNYRAYILCVAPSKKAVTAYFSSNKLMGALTVCSVLRLCRHPTRASISQFLCIQLSLSTNFGIFKGMKMTWIVHSFSNSYTTNKYTMIQLWSISKLDPCYRYWPRLLWNAHKKSIWKKWFVSKILLHNIFSLETQGYLLAENRISKGMFSAKTLSSNVCFRSKPYIPGIWCFWL